MTISYHSVRETHEGVSLLLILCESIPIRRAAGNILAFHFPVPSRVAI